MFKSPKESLGALDARAAAELVGTSTDIALVVDSAGTIRDLFIQDAELEANLGASHRWIGQSWRTHLNAASHARAKSLLADAAAGKPIKWRNLNHVGRDGGDSPMLYAAMQLRSKGSLVLFGRDSRPIAALHQRLMDAQQTIERDHLRIRQLELRHRLLLDSSPEPLLVLNAAAQKITEANPAMARLLGRTAADLAGGAVLDLFDAADRAAILGTLAATRAGTAAAPIEVHLAGPAGSRSGLTLGTTLFRDDHALFVLLRLAEPARTPQRREGVVTQDLPSLLQLVEHVPDGFVVTDATGHIQSVNPAFLAMAELERPRDAIGQSLDRWLGSGGIDLDILLTNLRQRGIVQLFGTSMAGASGLANTVEVSAVTLEGGALGFAIRDVGRRVVDSRPGRDMPRSVDQLTKLIGRVPLKDLVREATDMIERLCIEAALEITKDNRASAADLLGLSRQSLYVKLRRYGLGDLAEIES